MSEHGDEDQSKRVSMRELAEPKEADRLSKLTSSGPLSSSMRVGIMVALLPLKRATFTELLLALKVPKSSLNTSLAILEESGLVVVRKGFSTLRPRTFVEITQKGEQTIREHLALLKDLANRIL